MVEEKKEGFSYVSPEKQKKNAAKLLIFEVCVLIVVAVGIVGLLIYLGVINFNGILTSIKQPPTVGEQGIRGRLPPPNNTRNEEKNTNIKPSITVVSDVPNIIIKEKSEDKLLDFAISYDIFGKKYLLEPSKFSDFVRTIEVHITNQQQPSNKYFLTGSVPVTSSKLEFEATTLKMYIFLSPEAFSNEKISPEYYFMNSLVSNFYQMSKDPSGVGLNAAQQKELQAEIAKISQDKNLVVITRKESN